MKKIVFVMIALLSSTIILAQAEVKFFITNNSNQIIVYDKNDGDWNGFPSKLRPYIQKEIQIGETVSIYFDSKFLCGCDGWVEYKSKDNKSIIYLTYNNPSIGSSEYSASATGNYIASITSINSDVNPQIVNIEIKGGTPDQKPKVNIPNTGNNTIMGSITWDESTQGKPLSTDWKNIFSIKCTVPSSFQPIENGSQIYNSEKGIYMGSVQSGTILYSDLVIQGNIRTLPFTIMNIANNVQINNFDVQVKDGNVWAAPSTSNPPGVGYKYYAFTVLNEAVKIISPTNCSVAFGVKAGWADEKLGNTGTGDLSNAIQLRKKVRVLPDNTFMQITATKSRSNIKSQDINSIKQNVNKNMIKNTFKIRQ